MTNKKLDALNKKKSWSEFLVVIGGIIGVIGALLFVVYPVIVYGVIPLTAILMITGLIMHEQVKQTFRETFVKGYFNTLAHVDYFPKKGFGKIQGLSKDKVYESNYMERTNIFKTFDYLKGEIDGIAFESSDVLLQNQVNTGKSSHVVTIFHGRMFVFDFKKPIENEVLVLEKYKPRNKARGYDKIKTESVNFNQLFNIYAEDPHTAFYLLTPHFMEQLKTLEKNHPGNIGMSFQENKLYLSIHNGQSTFELKWFRPIDESVMNALEKDFNIIEQMIHTLKLSNHVYE